MEGFLYEDVRMGVFVTACHSTIGRIESKLIDIIIIIIIIRSARVEEIRLSRRELNQLD